MKQQNWKRSFFTIWAGQAISLITSAVLQMAIIWYLTDTTGSAMVLSMATMVGFLPQAILGTVIGVWVDRWNRKLVMIGADLIVAAAGAQCRKDRRHSGPAEPRRGEDHAGQIRPASRFMADP